MKILAGTFKAFLVGGLLAIVGQFFIVVLTLLMGTESIWPGPIALVLMGVVALVLYPLGVLKKLEDFGGFGVMLTFTGLAGAVAMSYQSTKLETGKTSSGIAAGIKAVAYIIGLGSIALVFVSLIIAFIF